MKAQFATIEAGMALAMIASAIAFVSTWSNSSTAGLDAQSASLQRSVAIYDIFNALERNATYNVCVSQLYLGNETGCLGGIEGFFAGIFGMTSVRIGMAGASSSEQNSTGACASMRLQAANATASVCVAVTNR